MPDRKKRLRCKKDEKHQGLQNHGYGSIILAKRDEERNSVIKPKILLKAPMRDPDVNCIDDNLLGTSAPLKTMIINRTEHKSASNVTVYGKEISSHVNDTTQCTNTYTNTNSNSLAMKDQKRETTPSDQEVVAHMTRPASIISASGGLNFSARKLIHKHNTDFFVVGVLGTVGVGKTTIMNLLARNHLTPYNYYQKVFVEQENIFPTKLKNASRARTESTHMFINSERMILLDTPPMLLNSFRKDLINSELDELQVAINLLSVCHLLIVVFDNAINLDLVRVLRMAKQLKSRHLHKYCVKDYLPNIMFVRNRAHIADYTTQARTKFDNMLKTFFGDDPNLNIYRRHNTIKPETTTNDDDEPPLSPEQNITESTPTTQLQLVNSFLFPEIKGNEATTYHASLHNIVIELRERVLATPRKDFFKTGEFNEMEWYELLVRSAQEGTKQFQETYTEVLTQHFELTSNGGGCSIMSCLEIASGVSTAPKTVGTNGNGGNSRSNSTQRQRERDRDRYTNGNGGVSSSGNGGGSSGSGNWREYNRTAHT